MEWWGEIISITHLSLQVRIKSLNLPKCSCGNAEWWLREKQPITLQPCLHCAWCTVNVALWGDFAFDKIVWTPFSNPHDKWNVQRFLESYYDSLERIGCSIFLYLGIHSFLNIKSYSFFFYTCSTACLLRQALRTLLSWAPPWALDCSVHDSRTESCFCDCKVSHIIHTSVFSTSLPLEF